MAIQFPGIVAVQPLPDDMSDPDLKLAAAVAERFGVTSPDTPPDDGPSPSVDSTNAPDPAESDGGSDVTERDGGAGAQGGNVPSPDPSQQAMPGGSGGGTPLVLTLENGAQIEVTEDVARRMLAVTQWADQLDRGHAATLRAIANGDAAAIPLDEYQRFQAWQQAQQMRQQHDPFADADLDDEQAQELARLRAEAAQARQQPAPRADPVARQQTQAELNDVQQQWIDSVESWRESRGLTQEEAGELLGVAIRTNTIQRFSEEGAQYAPDGTLIMRAPLGQVAEQSLNFALAARPDLFDRVATHRADAHRRAEAERLADQAVSRKRANASSLASGPSAATFTPTTDPRALTRQQQLEAIASDIKTMNERPG